MKDIQSLNCQSGQFRDRISFLYILWISIWVSDWRLRRCMSYGYSCWWLSLPYNCLSQMVRIKPHLGSRADRRSSQHSRQPLARASLPGQLVEQPWRSRPLRHRHPRSDVPATRRRHFGQDNPGTASQRNTTPDTRPELEKLSRWSINKGKKWKVTNKSKNILKEVGSSPTTLCMWSKVKEK